MAKSAFHDLFIAEHAAELKCRPHYLCGINKWLRVGESGGPTGATSSFAARRTAD